MIKVYVLYDNIAKTSLSTFTATNDEHATSILINTIGKGQLIHYDLEVIKVAEYDLANPTTTFKTEIKRIKSMHKK